MDYEIIGPVLFTGIIVMTGAKTRFLRHKPHWRFSSIDSTRVTEGSSISLDLDSDNEDEEDETLGWFMPSQLTSEMDTFRDSFVSLMLE